MPHLPTIPGRHTRRLVVLLAAVAATVALATPAAGAATPVGPGHIAFVRLVSAAGGGDVIGSDIWTIDPDGSHLRRLTTSHRATQPAWSPDGARIAYVGAGGIWLMRRDGGGQHLAVRASGVSVSSRPAWSPDGKRLAYSQGGAIWEVALAGALAQGSAQRVAAGSDPAWAPDGKHIAFVDTQRGAAARVWVAAPDGSGAVAITPKGSAALHLSWKSGAVIGFTSDPGGRSRVSLVTADGSQQVILSGFGDGVALSPDGSRAVLAAATVDGKGILSIVRRGSVTPLGPGFAPDWGS